MSNLKGLKIFYNFVPLFCSTLTQVFFWWGELCLVLNCNPDIFISCVNYYFKQLELSYLRYLHRQILHILGDTLTSNVRVLSTCQTITLFFGPQGTKLVKKIVRLHHSKGVILITPWGWHGKRRIQISQKPQQFVGKMKCNTNRDVKSNNPVFDQDTAPRNTPSRGQFVVL